MRLFRKCWLDDWVEQTKWNRRDEAVVRILYQVWEAGWCPVRLLKQSKQLWLKSRCDLHACVLVSFAF